LCASIWYHIIHGHLEIDNLGANVVLIDIIGQLGQFQNVNQLQIGLDSIREGGPQFRDSGNDTNLQSFISHCQEHLLLAETSVAPQGSALRDLELPVEEAPESLMPLAAGQTIVRAALDSHERIALVTSDGSSERVWRVDDDHVSLLTPRPLRYGPTLAFTAQGSIALSVGGAGKPSLFVLWRSSGPPLRLDPVPAVGFVLP